MKKYAKVNPYEKKKKRSLKLNRKQWTTLISVLAAIAILVGVIVVARQAAKGNNGHYEGDGHNHGSEGEHYEGDGHDHSPITGTPSTNAAGSTQPTSGHTHNSSATDKVKYQVYSNADKTFRLVIRDSKNEIVFEKDNLSKQPIKNVMDEENGVYELGWATGDGANEFECIYYNVKTGQVSEAFVAPRGCDGTRVAYGSADQKKVIVQDLFDKNTYYKEYELTNAIEKNGNIIIGGRLHENKKTVVISYNSSESESSAHVTIDLYK